jgi:hypothetical protein
MIDTQGTLHAAAEFAAPTIVISISTQLSPLHAAVDGVRRSAPEFEKA